MLQKQQNSTAGLWTWVWSCHSGVLHHISYCALLWPSFSHFFFSCRETLTFWDVWIESSFVSHILVWQRLIRSFTAETRCRGSCSRKKKDNEWRAQRNWNMWQAWILIGVTTNILKVIFKISGGSIFKCTGFQVRPKGIAVVLTCKRTEEVHPSVGKTECNYVLTNCLTKLVQNDWKPERFQ